MYKKTKNTKKYNKTQHEQLQKQKTQNYPKKRV